jgi:serine/threonine protein kinase
MEFMKVGQASRAFRAFHEAHRPSRPDRAAGSNCNQRLEDVCEEIMTAVRVTAWSSRELGPGQSASIAPDPAILKPGRRLGPYRLLERLGQGGQGDVWKTRRLGPGGELVALKVLKPELAHHPARMAQFRREAERGLRLTGPSLLAAYELYEIDGFHCVTSSNGGSLFSAVKRPSTSIPLWPWERRNTRLRWFAHWPRPRVLWHASMISTSPTATSSRQTS